MKTRGARFKYTTAKGELKAKEPVWTAADFDKHFQKLPTLEAELERIVKALEPKRIKWPEPAQMPAYLQSGFFMGTPLVLIKEAERAERYDPKK